jgi:hypothetical protein
MDIQREASRCKSPYRNISSYPFASSPVQFALTWREHDESAVPGLPDESYPLRPKAFPIPRSICRYQRRW